MTRPASSRTRTAPACVARGDAGNSVRQRLRRMRRRSASGGVELGRRGEQLVGEPSPRIRSSCAASAASRSSPSALGTTPRTWWTLSRPPRSRRPRRPCRGARPAPGASPTSSTGASHSALEVGDPRPQRPGVVLAKRLDVADLEPGPLHRQHGLADVDQLAVGEHVAADERAPADLRAADRADGVVEQPALRRARTSCRMP